MPEKSGQVKGIIDILTAKRRPCCITQASFIYRSLPGSRYAAPDLHQQQYYADPQQYMSDPGNAGNCRIHAGGKCGHRHLGHSPHHKHHGGQIQTGMIDGQYTPCFRTGERKVLLQQEKQEKKHHAQQEIMGMDN